MSTVLYFAYGSNMLVQRLRERTPSAQVIGRATLRGHELAWHKRGQDGSGKCDLVRSADPDAQAQGVLYALDGAERPLLDKAEGLGHGYDAAQLTVQTLDGMAHRALMYVATDIDARLAPYDWYKALVLAGAIQHGLPAKVLRAMDAVASHADPDALRAEHHWRLVQSGLDLF
ncbi:gamma-glutamylcyclotransferase family protein [Hydrogenophaga sp. 5NK40-0174]|uniref:gamma-glutamylcyclotransferase family protein n=1 Tax=Hydrogenophaga sp. 5NK40-0174 TaxID=3127649 RepID=UPI00310AFFBD